MARPAIIVLLMLSAVASPAQAQFPNILDSIFGNPPRPPSDVPNRPSYEPQYAPPPGRQGIGPPPSQQSGLPPGPPPGRIQMQPLPPPPGAASAPPSVRMPPGAPPGTQAVPPGQRPPARAPAAPQPPDEVVVEPSQNKVPNPTAVFAGLDKITGRIISFDVAINETVRFGALEVTPRACFTRPPTEQAQTDGFIEVDELTLQGELRRIFTGWMFAASPGLSAVEHPIYDIWLTDCRGGAPPTLTSEAPVEPAPPQRRQPAQRAQNPQQPGQQQPQPRRTQPPPQMLPPPPQR